MKAVTWDNKLVDFLANYNTILVKEKDIDLFVERMETVGLDARRLKTQSEIYGDLLVEYNNNKGFTFWNMVTPQNPVSSIEIATKESIKWFGVEPLQLEEIL